MNVYITDPQGDRASFIQKKVTVTLHFKKRQFKPQTYLKKVGTTYVSDPRVWKSFYQNMIDGKFNPGHYRGHNNGSGIANM